MDGLRDLSAQKRTRTAGAKYLKNHEVALIHQHFLRRNKVQKDTVFVIHGVKQDFNNIRRRIRRLKDVQLKPLEDSSILPPLPPYIELRSPSPELTQFQAPEVDIVDTAPQQPEEISTSMSQMDLHIINTGSDERTAEKDEDEIMTDRNAVLSNSSRSQMTEIFRASRSEDRGSGVLLPRDGIQSSSRSRKDPYVGAKPISMEIENLNPDQGSRPRRESPAGSLMDGMSWGGISVGSFSRDDVLMDSSPSVFGQFSPLQSSSLQSSSLKSSSFQSTSYFSKLEHNFMKDVKCCDQTLLTMHDILQHYEENHHGNPSM